MPKPENTRTEKKPELTGKKSKKPVKQPKGKRAQIRQAYTDPKTRTDRLDTLMASLVQDVAKQTQNPGVLVTSSADTLVAGIPLPSLALEWVFGLNVIPLSCFIQIMGRPGSCKSALLYEIFRWYTRRGGMGVLLENETKASLRLVNSIIGYNNKHVAFHPCDSLEMWQGALNEWIGKIRSISDGTKTEPGPGRIIPVAIGVDSLLGKAAIENLDRIDKEGYASKNFPVEANLISSFLKYLPQKLADIPITFFGTNHLKTKSDKQGNVTDYTPGGVAIDYHESIALKMQVFKKKLIASAFRGIALQLTCTKSSLSETGRSAVTRMIWTHEPFTDSEGRTRRRQATTWDWGWATIRFLTSMEDTHYKNAIRDVVDLQIHQTGDATANVSSKKLGISKNEPRPWTEAGLMIQRDAKLKVALREALDIAPCHEFQLDVDYRDQLKNLRKKLI